MKTQIQEKQTEAIYKDFSNIESLTKHIQSLKGLARKEFCQQLPGDIQKKYIECLREMDQTMVTGRYEAFFPRNSLVKFSSKFYGMRQPETYNLRDNEEYRIPYGVAKHLRDRCGIDVHSNRVNHDGTVHKEVGKRIKSHNFSPSEFIV